MRKASVAEILEAQHEAQGHFYPLRPLDIFLPWTPMVGTGDPSSLADQPLSMFIHNQVSSPVPLIIGVVRARKKGICFLIFFFFFYFCRLQTRL